MGIFAAASGVTSIDIIFALIGSGGLVSAIVAIYKLRPDMNTMSVTQAQGAAESLALAHQQLMADRDAWRVRALACEEEVTKLHARLEDCERAHARRHRD